MLVKGANGISISDPMEINLSMKKSGFRLILIHLEKVLIFSCSLKCRAEHILCCPFQRNRHTVIKLDILQNIIYFNIFEHPL